MLDRLLYTLFCVLLGSQVPDARASLNDIPADHAYTANGLDQYGRIMGDTPAWDARGNLAGYRGSSWGYDGENRLAAVNLAAGTVTTAYDPAGRLRQIGASATTQMLYDGARLELSQASSRFR